MVPFEIFHDGGGANNLELSKDGTRPDIGFKTSYDDTFFFGVKLMKHYYKKFDTFDYKAFVLFVYLSYFSDKSS